MNGINSTVLRKLFDMDIQKKVFTMANIIPFICPAEERTSHIFINKPVLLLCGEKPVQYPCIGLYRRDTVSA